MIMFDFSFFFNDTATTEIYTLSLHDALPIWSRRPPTRRARPAGSWCSGIAPPGSTTTSAWRSTVSSSDRKSTRLNSSHANISYAVFCLKKKKTRLSLLVHLTDQSLESKRTDH